MVGRSTEVHETEDASLGHVLKHLGSVEVP